MQVWFVHCMASALLGSGLRGGGSEDAITACAGRVPRRKLPADARHLRSQALERCVALRVAVPRRKLLAHAFERALIAAIERVRCRIELADDALRRRIDARDILGRQIDQRAHVTCTPLQARRRAIGGGIGLFIPAERSRLVAASLGVGRQAQHVVVRRMRALQFGFQHRVRFVEQAGIGKHLRRGADHGLSSVADR